MEIAEIPTGKKEDRDHNADKENNVYVERSTVRRWRRTRTTRRETRVPATGKLFPECLRNNGAAADEVARVSDTVAKTLWKLLS